MLKNLVLAIVVLICAAFNLAAQDSMKYAKTSADETAIRDIVKQLENGWNTHDGKIFAAPFAPDADYVVVNGFYIKGKEAIERGHNRIFTTVYKDSHNLSTVKSIRFLRPDVAIAHVGWHLEYKNEAGEMIKGDALTTLVFAKENGKWGITAFQNTPVREQGNN